MPESVRHGTEANPPVTLLAFDFGLRRIGVASGNTLTRSAIAQSALPANQGNPDWPQLQRLVREFCATQLVVGKPYNVDGTTHVLCAASDRFAAELAAQCGLPVHRVDERYSSLEASESLRNQRHSGARRKRVDKADVDSVAAAVILARWLNGEEA